MNDLMLAARRIRCAESSGGSSRPYQEIAEVRISPKNSTQEPIAYVKINNFTLNKDTFIMTPTIYYSMSPYSMQIGVSADSDTGQRFGAYYYVTRGGNGTEMAIMLGFNNGNPSSSVWKYEAYTHDDPFTTNYTINNSSQPQMSGASYNGWIGGSASSYQTWVNTYNQTEFGRVYFKRGKENGACVYFKGLTIRNDSVLIADIVPVKFLDNNTYGVLDKISGNYADDNSFSISGYSFTID